MKHYIYHVTFRQPNFVVSDLLASAKTCGVEIQFPDPEIQIGIAPKSLFIEALLSSDEDAIAVAKHSVCVRQVLNLWNISKTFQELITFCKSYQHNVNDGTFAIKVESYLQTLDNETRLDMIHQLVESLRINSKCDLKNPASKLILCLEYEYEGSETPIRVLLGKYLDEGLTKLPDLYSQKKRSFINKTTMEVWLALMSARQGLCKPGSLILDPFVGSGSLMIAAAVFGSYCIGADFDLPSMFHTHEHSIFGNFEQYNLQDKLIGLVKADFLKDSIQAKGQFDAIITDPPYGIREKCIADDISPLQPLLLHLYDYAARALKVNGRLVYWLPCGYDLNVEKDLPKHPALKLISDCQQDLSSRYCRHLITLEKINNTQGKVEFSNFEASWLKVRTLVFEQKPDLSSLPKKERKAELRRRKAEQTKP